MSYKARIKFDNREWLVVDNFEHKGVEYFYIIEDISEKLEKLNNIEDYKGNFAVEFIYKSDDVNYRNVTDQELINELSAIVGLRALYSKEE